MSKYHVNKKGEITLCKATKVNCPLGGEELHFDANNAQEANVQYMQRLNDEYEGKILQTHNALKPWIKTSWNSLTYVQKIIILKEIESALHKKGVLDNEDLYSEVRYRISEATGELNAEIFYAEDEKTFDDYLNNPEIVNPLRLIGNKNLSPAQGRRVLFTATMKDYLDQYNREIDEEFENKSIQELADEYSNGKEFTEDDYTRPYKLKAYLKTLNDEKRKEVLTKMKENGVSEAGYYILKDGSEKDIEAFTQIVTDKELADNYDLSYEVLRLKRNGHSNNSLTEKIVKNSSRADLILESYYLNDSKAADELAEKTRDISSSYVERFAIEMSLSHTDKNYKNFAKKRLIQLSKNPNFHNAHVRQIVLHSDDREVIDSFVTSPHLSLRGINALLEAKPRKLKLSRAQKKHLLNRLKNKEYVGEGSPYVDF